MAAVKLEILGQAVELARRLGHIFVATTDAANMPHVAAAGEVIINGELVEVRAWFCPVTVANLEQNRAVSLVIWDPETDHGYQVLGRAERSEVMAVMDGYLPTEEDSHPLPQMERKLVIRPERILDFKHAPHSDTDSK